MRYLFITTAFIFILMSGLSEGAGRKISEIGNKHNFSYMNISSNFRAVQGGDTSGFNRDAQICVFCHTPHRSSGEGPLWNRAASTRTFKHFSSATLAIDDAALQADADYGQPTGSSRLCLSCHDGVTAIGAVFTTPGSITPINIPTITSTIGYETYSSHHPVSFRYNQTVRNLLKGAPYNKDLQDLPPTSYDVNVKLDKQERMQCTTCHDPHQDKSDVPGITHPFWVTTTYEKVCESCHNTAPAYPWIP